jgi:hypothetical protein
VGATFGGRRGVLIATLTIALAACGGSEDDATRAVTVTENASGHAEYVAEADALCSQVLAGSEVNESLAELRQIPETSPEFRERAAAHYRLILDLAVGAKDELQAIEPPEADRPRVEEFFELNEETIEALRDVIAAIERGETSPDTINEYIGLLAEGDRLAEAIGFEICGRTGLG